MAFTERPPITGNWTERALGSSSWDRRYALSIGLYVEEDYIDDDYFEDGDGWSDEDMRGGSWDTESGATKTWNEEEPKS